METETYLLNLCEYQNRGGFLSSGSQAGAKERNPVPAAFMEGWQREAQVLPWAGDKSMEVHEVQEAGVSASGLALIPSVRLSLEMKQ